MQAYNYNGARTLILLHEKYMKSFVETWSRAKSSEIQLPKTDDPDYASYNSLLYHVMNSSKSYLEWICKNLTLDDPGLRDVPYLDKIENERSDYLKHLLSRWRVPLAKIEVNLFFNQTFTSKWGSEYTIEAMLEHAVLHAIRHEYQLQNLMNKNTI